MAITAIANPTRLQWSNFTASSALPAGEDAHINPRFDVPNRPIRRVGTQFMLAETFQITVTPVARVRPVAAPLAMLIDSPSPGSDASLLRALSPPPPGMFGLRTAFQHL